MQNVITPEKAEEVVKHYKYWELRDDSNRLFSNPQTAQENKSDFAGELKRGIESGLFNFLILKYSFSKNDLNNHVPSIIRLNDSLSENDLLFKALGQAGAADKNNPLLQQILGILANNSLGNANTPGTTKEDLETFKNQILQEAKLERLKDEIERQKADLQREFEYKSQLLEERHKWKEELLKEREKQLKELKEEILAKSEENSVWQDLGKGLLVGAKEALNGYVGNKFGLGNADKEEKKEEEEKVIIEETRTPKFMQKKPVAKEKTDIAEDIHYTPASEIEAEKKRKIEELLKKIEADPSLLDDCIELSEQEPEDDEEQENEAETVEIE